MIPMTGLRLLGFVFRNGALHARCIHLGLATVAALFLTIQSSSAQNPWARGPSGSGGSNPWARGPAGSGIPNPWARGPAGSSTPNAWARASGATSSSNAWSREGSGPYSGKSNPYSKSVSLPVDVTAALPSMVPQAMNYDIPDGIYGVRRRLRPIRRVSGVPPAEEKRLASDEVLIEIVKSLSPQALEAMQRRHRLTMLQSQKVELLGTTVLRLRIADKRKVAAVVRELEGDKDVASAQPNYIFTSRQDQAVKDVGLRVADRKESSIAPEHTGSIATPVVSDGRLLIGTSAAPADEPSIQERPGAERRTYDILRALDLAAKDSGRAVSIGFSGPNDPVINRSLEAARKKDMGLAASDDAGPKLAPTDPAADPIAENNP